VNFLAIIHSAGRADQDHVRRAGHPEIRTPDFDLHFVTSGRGEIRVGDASKPSDRMSTDAI
jgi:hypothetical protein